MRRLLLFLLLSGLAQAQEYRLLQPAQPCWCLSGDRVPLEVEAPAGLNLTVTSPDGPSLALSEGPPGHYRAVLSADKTRSLFVGGQPLGTLECLDPVRPAVEVAKPDAVYRSGPTSDDDRYDPLPAGLRLQVRARRGDWVQVWPGEGWVRLADTRALPPGTSPSQAVLSHVVATETSDRAAELRLTLDQPCAWQTVEENGRLFLRLPGARMQMFETSYPQGARRVQLIQLHPGAQETRVEVGAGRLWGYRLRWEAPDLVLSLGAPPERASLEGVRITLDAGHGGADGGATGMRGTREKDLNLAVALALRDELQAAGAIVSMTRQGDAELTPPDSGAETELNARVAASEAAGAQLFVSIHHNASADLAVGRRSHGTHVYFYRPQSRELAEALAGPAAAAIGEPSFKHLWRSFNVTRQTAAPAVLVELNFLSNPALEQEMLTRAGYPQRAAAGLRRGLENYLLKAVGQE